MPKLKVGHISPTPEEDAAITAAAMADPDAVPYTDEEWTKVKPLRGPGRPAGSGVKQQVSLRIDVDIIEAFKGQGSGWQTKMNEVLKEWVKTHRM
jgi:uncharacterized protein (DUF4415 family)